MRTDDPSRYAQWWYTLVWLLQLLVPFTLMDSLNAHVRVWMSHYCSGIDASSLHHKNIHHFLCELYSAARQQLCSSIQPMHKRALPSFCLMIDLWTSKTSNEKYMGKSCRHALVGQSQGNRQLIRILL